MAQIWKEPFAPHRMTAQEKSEIERTAQGILDARATYSGKSLAELYNPETMPPELKAAHDANDAAVDAAYGIHRKVTDAERVAFLFRLYQWHLENSENEMAQAQGQLLPPEPKPAAVQEALL